MNNDAEQLHATAVAIGNRGILLLGPSGAGKSDLALRLIDHGAHLVADDRVDAATDGYAVILSAPRELAGLLEGRGVGIIRMPHISRVPLSLVCELAEEAVIERLPESIEATFMGVTVRRIVVDPFEASAAAKIRLALTTPKKDMLEP